MLNRIFSRVKGIAKPIALQALASFVEVSWSIQRARRKPHTLPNRLILSLTSYNARFDTLHLTLKSLLMQSQTPDETILWVSHSDFDKLPKAVLILQQFGLTIRATDDIRSYKKIIPALREFSDCIIVTADDDVYYWRTWLEELTQHYQTDAKEVICHRGHKIALDEAGRPRPYLEWEGDIHGDSVSGLISFTGIGGVLYPPRILHSDASAAEVFLQCCPTADDIWLYWMARLNGATIRKVGKRRRFVTWAGSQVQALHSINVSHQGGNDRQIANMVRIYGFPGE